MSADLPFVAPVGSIAGRSQRVRARSTVTSTNLGYVGPVGSVAGRSQRVRATGATSATDLPFVAPVGSIAGRSQRIRSRGAIPSGTFDRDIYLISATEWVEIGGYWRPVPIGEPPVLIGSAPVFDSSENPGAPFASLGGGLIVWDPWPPPMVSAQGWIATGYPHNEITLKIMGWTGADVLLYDVEQYRVVTPRYRLGETTWEVLPLDPRPSQSYGDGGWAQLSPHYDGLPDGWAVAAGAAYGFLIPEVGSWYGLAWTTPPASVDWVITSWGEQSEVEWEVCILREPEA